MVLGRDDIKSSYLNSLSNNEEVFWYNIGDILIYYNDKNENDINLETWKSSLDEIENINWTNSKKRIIWDIISNNKKDENLREYRIRTFLHLLKLFLLVHIKKENENKIKQINIKLDGNLTLFIDTGFNNLNIDEIYEQIQIIYQNIFIRISILFRKYVS